MNTNAPYLLLETEGNRRLLIQDPTTLGRSPENLVPMNDVGCSSRHAIIRKENGQWMLEDVGSTNGTWVNGTAIQKPHPLQEGDCIQLGAQVLRVGGLGSRCTKCGQELPPKAAFCPGCGLPLGSMPPPRTMVMTPPSLTPCERPAPPPIPQDASPVPALPPMPPPPVPVMPTKTKKTKRGCWLSCCLGALVLLVLAGLAAWFLWHRFSKQIFSPTLGQVTTIQMVPEGTHANR